MILRISFAGDVVLGDFGGKFVVPKDLLSMFAGNLEALILTTSGIPRLKAGPPLSSHCKTPETESLV